MMNEEGTFTRILELIQEKNDDDAGLHRLLLELLYEMSRIQRLRIEDLSKCDCEYRLPMDASDVNCSINRRRVHHPHV